MRVSTPVKLRTLTNSIENPSREAKSFSSVNESPTIMETEILYRFRNTLPFVLEPHKLSPVQPPCFIKTCVNVIVHSAPKPSQTPVSSCLPNKLCMSLSSITVTCPEHLVRLDLIIVIYLVGEIQTRNNLSCDTYFV